METALYSTRAALKSEGKRTYV